MCEAPVPSPAWRKEEEKNLDTPFPIPLLCLRTLSQVSSLPSSSYFQTLGFMKAQAMPTCAFLKLPPVSYSLESLSLPLNSYTTFIHLTQSLNSWALEI
jgi:hypothetical protein